jgi:hypothetical protein
MVDRVEQAVARAAEVLEVAEAVVLYRMRRRARAERVCCENAVDGCDGVVLVEVLVEDGCGDATEWLRNALARHHVSRCFRTTSSCSGFHCACPAKGTPLESVFEPSSSTIRTANKKEKPLLCILEPDFLIAQHQYICGVIVAMSSCFPPPYQNSE